MNDNVIKVIKNGVEYLQFKRLLEYEEYIIHAYTLGLEVDYRTTTIEKENLPEDKYKKVMESYKKVADSFDFDFANFVKTNQNHTDNVQSVDKKINENAPDINVPQYDNTDGFITNKQKLALVTTNADCILMLFFDPVTKTIANVHSGWKGTLQRISVKTVRKMVKDFNCNPQNIICCMCPSIRKCHFEVEKKVKDMFEKEFCDLNLDKIITKQKCAEKYNIDTVLINKMILKKEGLQEENIIDSGICSVCNSKLMHSFRVEKEKYGLEIGIIALKE